MRLQAAGAGNLPVAPAVYDQPWRSATSVPSRSSHQSATRWLSESIHSA